MTLIYNSQKINNNPNPILIQYRKLVSEGSDPKSLAWVITRNSVGGNLVRFKGSAPGHIHHARRVLEKLVNVYG